VMFCCASGAAGWCGDVALCKAGLTDISLARLGGAFAVLGGKRKNNKKSFVTTFITYDVKGPICRK